MNPMGEFDPSQILSSLYRRKGVIIAIFLVVSCLGAYLAAILPEVYKSSTLISVTPQRVPGAMVSSTITMELGERMQSIIQEILSRTQLEKIIQEFNIFPGSTKGAIPEERVEALRKKIKVEFRRNNIFEMSFESESPDKAKQVTGRLASLFIEQNLQLREQQAIGTRTFINAEAERLRKELEEQEVAVNQYKATNRFELPEQLDSNLRSLEQLRRELESSSQRLAALHERKGILQKQVVESDLGVDLLGGSLFGSMGDSGGGATQNVQLQLKKKELDLLLQRYSVRHPDVARLEKEIKTIEADAKNFSPAKTTPEPSKMSNVNPMKQVLQTQISEIDGEIQSLRSQHEGVRNQIGALQGRVDNAPVRAIELSKVSRGYEITLRKYQDLLAKSLDSELSENMEKKQKGEQFQIVDPANFPLKPVRPNRPMVVLFGLLAGLAGGMGVAFLWDNLDTSFKRSEELAGFIDIPVLATIPMLITRGNILDQRRAQGVVVFASIATLIVGIVCVRVFAPMYF
jgi:polysaccharide chain length determinant protein (PEP-CTERM system associated)